MRKIIFDLDGTLWETKQSYLYAYDKIVLEYKIENRVTNEEIMKYMGVKLNDLINALFLNFLNKEEISSKAVNYSIEYVLKHPKTFSDSIKELFSRLALKFDIYIISNCPRVYLNAFYKISGVKDEVKQDFTIEDGEKEDHLRIITNGYKDKAIFIGDATSDFVSILNHKKVYFVYAKYGYIKASKYDYFINCLDEVEDVIQKIAIKDEMLKKDNYEIISSNDSNLTIIDKKDCLYFGFLNFTNDMDDRIVIKELKERVSENKIMGPMNGSTWYSYRLALDNFDWELYPDAVNDERVLNLFLEEGFEIEHKYSSTLATINEKLWKRAKKVKLSEEYLIKVLHKQECYLHLDELFEVAVGAFAKADYYEPISLDDFKKIYIQSLKACSPDLVLIYYKGKLIAFSFSYEDLEKRFYVSKTAAIKKEFQSTGILLKLIDESYQIMTNKGYKEVLYHFQNDRTKTLYSIAGNSILKRKYYGLLRYTNEKKSKVC